jgi:phosphonate transport system substrate-binding protein
VGWYSGSSRREVMTGAAAAAACIRLPRAAGATDDSIRFGLTPVFLNNDLELLDRLRAFLARSTGQSVSLVQRRTYEEITSLLVSGQLTAAWICGYPYIQYRSRLSLLAVPVWRGRPYYQSYLIVGNGREAASLDDLKGDIHAFSDPNSNSGCLVTRALLAQKRLRPNDFFGRTFYTYSHRNVVRAVASGLADSGSVDGYVWEVLAEVEPELIRQTRIVSRSEWLGFPPVACEARQAGSPRARAVQSALTQMSLDPDGAAVLKTLRLDGFVPGPPDLFDGIAKRVELVQGLGT